MPETAGLSQRFALFFTHYRYRLPRRARAEPSLAGLDAISQPHAAAFQYLAACQSH